MAIDRLQRAQIRSRQEKKFAALLNRVLRSNPFYQDKYRSLNFTSSRPVGLSDLKQLPLISEAELLGDQQAHPPFGTNLTFPLSRYTRLHRSPGASGRTLAWLDTAESWSWWLDCWIEAYRAAGVNEHDRVLVASAFGPFIGSWAAYEAAHALGALATPGGGLDVAGQLDIVRRDEITVLVSTPAHALRLSERARREDDDPGDSSVRLAVACAEPRAASAGVKQRIREAWRAECYETALATEIGVWGFECGRQDRLHVNEVEFVVEAVDPGSRRTVDADAGGTRRGEMVLTNLGRVGSPVVRYCTGHLVELTRGPCDCGRDTALVRIVAPAPLSADLADDEIAVRADPPHAAAS